MLLEPSSVCLQYTFMPKWQLMQVLSRSLSSSYLVHATVSQRKSNCWNCCLKNSLGNYHCTDSCLPHDSKKEQQQSAAIPWQNPEPDDSHIGKNERHHPVAQLVSIACQARQGVRSTPMEFLGKETDDRWPGCPGCGSRPAQDELRVRSRID